MTKSPTGKRVVESSGPLSAEIVFIGESPAVEEVNEGTPFVGKSGKLLNAALRNAGVDRTQVRLMNCVPVRAPADHFADHPPEDVQFGRERFFAELQQLTKAKVYVTLGANPTEWLVGGKLPVAQRHERQKDGFIGEWRGSIIPAYYFDQDPLVFENYLARINTVIPPIHLNKDSAILPTFHPAAILRQFTWNPWLVMDVRKAARIAVEGLPVTPRRQWYFNDVEALERLVEAKPDLISVDTEMDPWIVGLATEDEVHVFVWEEAFRRPLEALLTSDRILKVAHNWAHDYAFIRVQLDITVARPYFDTQGGAHELDNALQKELSPHIATRFTNWPYHKWLTNVDQLVYCGMDSVVCYDAYWPMLSELTKRGLYAPARLPNSMPSVAEFDHKLLTPLMEMQAVGFKIDESARQAVESDLLEKLDTEQKILQKMVEPIIEKQIGRFEKPHLFQVERKCDCCGGGKTQRVHCSTCYYAQASPVVYTGCRKLKDEARARGFKTIKAFKAIWPECTKCGGTGKIIKKLEFNPDSPDQLADVIYRGLHIRPRRFKGNETTKAAQLDPIKDKHPIIARIVDTSKLRADYDTVARLRAGFDGLLHCVFDPFGTGSGRVAGKEGLVEVGTNPMNLPLTARRFVVPRDGYIFLYPDEAQIEARAVAVLSGDKNLIGAFTTPLDWPGHAKHGKIDSHTRVVQLMLGSGAQITRDQAKRLTYAAMYGARAAQLAVELNAEAFRRGQDLRLTTDQVQFMLDTFFRVFSGVRQWQERVTTEVLQTNRLRCPFTGRERTWHGYIVDTRKKLGGGRINPDYGRLKYEIAKQAWSFLPQHIGAWILGLGLIDMYYNTDEWGKLLQPLVHVHDALLIETPIARVEEGKALALKLLTREAFGITFLAEMKTGMNWLEASGG